MLITRSVREVQRHIATENISHQRKQGIKGRSTHIHEDTNAGMEITCCTKKYTHGLVYILTIGPEELEVTTVRPLVILTVQTCMRTQLYKDNAST